ncbi:hypothetical protein NHQ30_001428 [Ciborinia camelliae]|nr:hypothetical protein NHQ30_001428 [Ciborinia camelliae]
MTSQVKFIIALCVLLNTLATVQGYQFTVGPVGDVSIEKLEATLTVPEFSKVCQQLLSAGIINQAGNYSYENDLSSGNPGKWQVDMRRNHDYIETDDMILPGDKIYSLFEYNSATSMITNNATVIPGPASINAGLKERYISQQESFPTNASAVVKFNVARLYVSLCSGATWDFGPVLWENVTITSETTDTWWCNQAWEASEDLHITGGVSKFWGERDQTICSYDYMYWEPAKTGNYTKMAKRHIRW